MVLSVRSAYVFRAAGRLLVPVSLAELCELLTCAYDAGHEGELIHACYAREPLRTASDLELGDGEPTVVPVR